MIKYKQQQQRVFVCCPFSVNALKSKNVSKLMMQLSGIFSL